MSVEVVNAGFAVQHLENYVVALPSTVSNSRVQTVSNGTQVQFPIPFPYIDTIDVIVLINGLIVEYPRWSFVNPTLIQIDAPQTKGILVEVRRQTSLASLVTFTDGAVLTGADLNLATLQNLYLIQEFNDLYAAGLNGALQQVAGFNGPVTVTPAEMIAAVADQVLSSSLAISLQQRITDIDLNAQALLAQSTVIDGINDIIDSLTGVGGVGVVIATETASRIAADSALQSQLTLLGAFNGTQTAFIINQATAFVDPTTSLATYITNQTANFAAATTALNTEATTRATADTALSTLVTALTSSLATSNAAITTEATTRASGDTALASTITTLSATVGTNTAALVANATVVAGLSAQYTIKVDVNGHVAGFGLASLPINGATVSSFIVQANNFSIVDPGNGLSAPIVPFSVTGGVVFMNSVVINGALIQNATITNAQIANLTVGTAQLAANSVTNLSANASAATVTCTATSIAATDTTVITLVATTTGGQVLIDADCMLQVATNVTSMSICNLQIYRDGSPVTNGMKFDPTFGGTINVSGGSGTAFPGPVPVSLKVLDTPAAGSHTYTLHAQCNRTSAASASLQMFNNFISVMEIKK